uniref:Secreted protein n=1 Tax=Loa loa TaxID=7209 RepID=A0A1I7VLS7_LOALO
MFSFIVLLLFTSLGCYGILEINGDELLLKTDSIMHARHVRGTDKGNLEGHHVVSRRPARREVIQNRKPKNILKNKKYKTIQFS